jgi:hypothetical protein
MLLLRLFLCCFISGTVGDGDEPGNPVVEAALVISNSTVNEELGEYFAYPASFAIIDALVLRTPALQ